MLLAVLGILLVGSLSTGSLLKGIFAGAFGIAIGAVGMDPLTFTSRFTFDIPLLRGDTSCSFSKVCMHGPISRAWLSMKRRSDGRCKRSPRLRERSEGETDCAPATGAILVGGERKSAFVMATNAGSSSAAVQSLHRLAGAKTTP